MDFLLSFHVFLKINSQLNLKKNKRLTKNLPPLFVQETLQSDSSSSPASNPDASLRSYFSSLPIL